MGREPTFTCRTRSDTTILTCVVRLGASSEMQGKVGTADSGPRRVPEIVARVDTELVQTRSAEPRRRAA